MCEEECAHVKEDDKCESYGKMDVKVRGGRELPFVDRTLVLFLNQS